MNHNKQKSVFTNSKKEKRIQPSKKYPERSSHKKNSLDPHGSKNGCNYLSATKKDSTGVSKPADMKKVLEVIPETQSIAATLPEEVLQMIFKFLSVEDLISVQKVCSSWKAATSHTLLWRHAPLWITDEQFNKLIDVPYLHTVCGISRNGTKLFEALVSNIIDLRKMNCCIYGNFSVDAFKKFVTKFKNLESMSINHTGPDTIKCTEILKTCPNLKELNLSKYTNTLSWKESLAFCENFPLVCKVISDGFSALTSLKLSCNAKQDIVANSNLVTNKLGQLTCLNLNYTEIYPDVWKLVFQSEKLKEMRINISRWPEIQLDFGRMTGLKSMILDIKHDLSADHPSASVYKTVVFPPNLESFVMYFPRQLKPEACVISDIVSSLPHLNCIAVVDRKKKNQSNRPENTSNLSDIDTAVFYRHSLVTKEVDYVLKCSGAKKMLIGDVIVTNGQLKCLKQLTYLNHIKFFDCTLNPEKLLPGILEMKYLKRILLFDCHFESDEITQNFIKNGIDGMSHFFVRTKY